MPQLKDIIRTLERLAPSYLAEKWDHVGLMVGDTSGEIKRVLCALDLNEDVVNEAVDLKSDCIITHHPFIFKPITKLDLSSDKGRIIKKLILNNISVYSMHTNYDIASGGTNDYIANKLGLKNIKVLDPAFKKNYCKVIVYVPENYVDKVRKVIISKLETHIGNYKGCTFSYSGEGSFIPLEGSSPFIGEKDSLCLTSEKSISFMVYEDEVSNIINEIKAVHPYEEMAYDVFKLENYKQTFGLGRFGSLEKPVSLENFINQLKRVFKIEYLRVSTMDKDIMVDTVSLCSGAGSDLIEKAAAVSKVYVTGDVKFHEAQLAKSLGLILIDVGHYASENMALTPIGDAILKDFKGVEINYSQVNGEMLFTR